jgi:S1-C subfamily serine protease
MRVRSGVIASARVGGAFAAWFGAVVVAIAQVDVVDIASARSLESRVQEALKRALPASVGLTALSEQGGTTGSGTIISSEGWILTAGHVTEESGQKILIHFADGSTIEGTTAGLHWEGREDCALVQFDPKGREFGVAELGEPSKLTVGSWVIALGHTYGVERDPFRPPVVRVGRVRLLDSASINIDAPISSGDSGGGTFDLDGRLIGINSTAGPEPDWNTAVNIDFVKPKLDEMKRGVFTGASAVASSQGKKSEAAVSVPRHDTKDHTHSKGSPAVLRGLAPAIDEAILMTVGVFVEGKAVGLGTVASSDGFVVAKASEVDPTSDEIDVALPDGLMVRGKRMAVDTELDLVLLQTGETFDEPLFSQDVPEQGAILVTAGRELKPLAYGVRSLGAYRPGRSDVTAAYLGVRARSASPNELEAAGVSGGVVLTMVSPASPAMRGGLKIGDLVTTIAGQSVSDQKQVGEAIRRHASGDVISVTRFRDGAQEEVQARLAPRPRESGPSPSSPQFPASRRASGFGPVIQHDAALRANQMGGPITTLDGKVVGINIARVDRTKTYAIASADLLPALEQLLVAARARSEPLPRIDPLAAGLVTKQEGATVRLDANAAEIVGSTVRFVHPEDGLAHLERWVDANDAARWVVEFTKAGDYGVRVSQSCIGEVAGQEFEVVVGETKMRGVTAATGDWDRYKWIDVGSFHVESPGRAVVEVRTGGTLRGPLMNLHAVEFKRSS